MELPTSPPRPESRPGRSVRLGEWRLLALIFLLFILRDAPWRLEEFDQAKQAYTSLEIVQAGHWWFQHLPGGHGVATKPPLVGWFSAGFYYLSGGNWDLAWRLPSLLGALALVGLLWRAGEELWAGWGGTLAAGAFALNFLTPRLAMLVRTDMPLTLEITVLGLVIWQRVRTGRPWTIRTRWIVFWLMLATMMTKGPIVYAFLLPGMVAHSWISRRRRDAASALPVPGVWGGWWHWTLPLLPFLFWLERGCVTVPNFYQEVVAHEFMGRFTMGEKAVHLNQPIYFYCLQIFARWAPWSLLLLATRVRARRVWWRMCAEPATLWLVCWAAGGLLCLSLVPSKRVDRIFPVIPPLCLLLTAALSAARHSTPANEDEGAPVGQPLPAAWPQLWSRRALWLAAVATVLATGVQVALVYRRNDHVWAQFGAQVRARQPPGRYGLVLTKKAAASVDESMLVYLRRLNYLDPAQAIQLASTGQLDSIVISAAALEKSHGLLARFDSAHPLEASAAGGRYLLLGGRVPPAPGPGDQR